MTSEERVEAIAISVHDAQDGDAEWAAASGRYRSQVRRSVRNVLAAIAIVDRRDAGNRYPTHAEAAQAAVVLNRCNGHDLDVWTNGSWPADTEWLATLAKKERPE